MIKRIITGTVLALVTVPLVLLQGWYLKAALLIIAFLCNHEIYAAFKANGARPVVFAGYLLSVLIFARETLGGYLPFIVKVDDAVIICFCAMLSIMGLVIRNKTDYKDFCGSMLPLLYPGAFFIAPLRIASINSYPLCLIAIALTLLMSCMNDVFAYFTGKAFGHKKLISGISPNKTIAGGIGGLIASAVFAVLVPLVITSVNSRFGLWEEMPVLPPYWVFAVFGIISGVFSDLGDLAASYVKRICGIKDFGHIFPGHGGMLDRADALMFSFVTVYLFITYCF